MKAKKYQQGAVSTAIYPGKLAYPALGLCGEIGEVLTATDKKSTEGEIGDVLWYVANVANDADLSLEDIVGSKSLKQSPKFNDPNYLFEKLAMQGGIVAENVKKTIRDTDGVLTERRKENIKSALSKIVSLLGLIAWYNETTLNKAAKANLKKLASRKRRQKLQGDGDDR